MATHDAVKLLSAARRNDQLALLEVGRLYLSGGNGLPKHLGLAYRYLSRAAARGNAEACRLIGDNIPAEIIDAPRSAIPWYEAAAASGSAKAKVVLAELYLAHGLSPDAAVSAKRLLEEAAATGEPSAQRKLALLRLKNDTLESMDEAVGLLAAASSGGARDAIHDLARFFWDRGDWDGWLSGAIPGQICLRSYDDVCERALACYARLNNLLVSANSPETCYRYGILMLTAERPDCVKWITRAAEAGHARAQYLRGLLSMGPVFMPRCPTSTSSKTQFAPLNYKTALTWHMLASRQGLAEANFAIHCLYSLRTFSQRSPSAAANFLTTAAEQGHSEAQFRLAKSLWLQGRRKPTAEVASWARRAAAQGHLAAQRLLNEIVECPPVLSQSEHRRADDAIAKMEEINPAIAARMRLRKVFGLTTREMLLLNVDDAHGGNHLEIRTSDSSRGKRRLIAIETSDQCAAWKMAVDVLTDPQAAHRDLQGVFRNRYRCFQGLCLRHGIHCDAPNTREWLGLNRGLGARGVGGPLYGI